MTKEKYKLSDIERLAVDGVIKRQQSLLDVMQHTDRRAQQFIVAYAGFIGGALLFALRSPAAGADTVLSGAVVLLYSVSLGFGALFGFLACKTVSIGLPSRSADFWQWALEEQHQSIIISEFLQAAETTLRENEEIQTNAARMLRRCMACGLLAIFIAGSGAIGHWLIEYLG